MLGTNDAHKQLEDILNKKEYQVYYKDSRNWLETWWDKALEWIGKQLAKLFPSIESANGAAAPILITLLVIILLLLALTTFFIIRTIKRNRTLRDNKSFQALIENNWSYERHLDEALKMESLEKYTDATRHLFLALLLYFQEKGWVEARIWKTNWDYIDELRKVNQQDVDQFSNLASFFDEVTYGERNVTKEEFKKFQTGTVQWLGATEQEQLSRGEAR